MHTIVDQILRTKSSVKFTIRFSIKDMEGLGAQVCSRLIEIYLKEGETKCMEALNDAYINMSLGKWMAKYGNTQNERILQVIADEREWCERNRISFTPEILINGKAFPKEYDRIDLPLVLESLAENVEEMSVC